MKNANKSYSLCLCCILLAIVVFPTIAFGQKSYQLSGVVSDVEGEPLTGVSVTIPGSSKGTITDIDGAYKLSVAQKNVTLLFAYLGYVSQREESKGRNIVNVVMEENVKELEEVVVIGYGTVSAKDLTGSVGQVKVDELAVAPVSSFSEALAGRIAGVQVVSSDGQPGSSQDIVIRGAGSLTQSNSPLYVIDGFPLEDFDASTVSNDDIKSLTILKDASATAIYGSRAANGVVLITTKKGKEGKPVITFKSSIGIQSVRKKMEMMSPYEFVTYHYELKPDRTDNYYLSRYNKTLEDYKGLKGYDWQEEILEDTPLTSIYNLNVSGGTKQTQYMISGSVFNQNGVIENSGYNNYRGRVSLDQNIGQNVNIGLSIINTRILTNGAQVAAGGSDTNQSTALLYRVWGYRPVAGSNVDLLEELADEDILSTTSSDVRLNPVITNQNDYRKTTTQILMANSYIEYKPSKNWTWLSTFSLNNNLRRQDIFNNSKTTQGSSRNPMNTRGQWGSITFMEKEIRSNENTLTFRKTYDRKHQVNAVGGFSLQKGLSSNRGSAATNVPNESLGIDGLDEGTPYSVTSSSSIFTMVSFFGRVNYNLNAKYLFTATFRGDASSKFSKNNRWGYFPSGAFAWNLSEEDFIKDIKWISKIKPRTSFGITGNNRVGDFAYQAQLSLPIANAYSFMNGIPLRGAILSNPKNSNLKWERTEQVDVGIDLGFFNGRLDMAIDWYDKTTKDLLLNADLPYTTGQSSAYKNIGKISNSGWEFSVNTTHISTRRMRWETNFNISFNRNKILALADDQEGLYSFVNLVSQYNNEPLYVSKVGQPAGLFYGYVFDGIYQKEDFDEGGVLKKEIPANGDERSVIQPGDVKYRDLNEDGVVNSYDQTVLGSAQPLHIGGFGNYFQVKRSIGTFSLGVFFQWSYGNKIYNANRLFFEGNTLMATELNQYKTYENRWTEENPSNEYFRTGGQGPVGRHSSRVLEDGSYLRLKTLSFGYDLPRKWAKRCYMRDININFAAQNLLTWTGYSGMDPEVSTRNNVLTPGFDYSAYPMARTITFGLKLIF